MIDVVSDNKKLERGHLWPARGNWVTDISLH